ncbi:hypothetical protein B0J17DRAFT_663818 [Rhizoctonia solani]|nr:hypothetical protein B0J17DRAFT_663818 [Rhizoctonia solani]
MWMVITTYTIFVQILLDYLEKVKLHKKNEAVWDQGWNKLHGDGKFSTGGVYRISTSKSSSGD